MRVLCLFLLLILLISCDSKPGTPFPLENDSLWQKLDEGTLKAQIKAGVDINAPAYNGQPPLHLALNGHSTLWSPQNALLLMRHKRCDINRKDSTGETPLLVALHYLPGGVLLNPQSGEKSKTKELLQQEELIAELIRKGADLTVRTSRGFTPLHYALYFGSSKETVTLLLNSGSDPNATVFGGNSPLFFGGDTAVFRVLVQKGAQVNLCNRSGETALHCALGETADVEKVQFLLNNGADKTLKDSNGFSALQRALRIRDFYSAKLREDYTHSRSSNDFYKEEVRKAQSVIAMLAPDGKMPADYVNIGSVLGFWQSMKSGGTFMQIDSSVITIFDGDGLSGRAVTGKWKMLGDSLALHFDNDRLVVSFIRAGDTLALGNGEQYLYVTPSLGEATFPGSVVYSMSQFLLKWPVEDTRPLAPTLSSFDATKRKLLIGEWCLPNLPFKVLRFKEEGSIVKGATTANATLLGHWRVQDDVLLFTDRRGVTYPMNWSIVDKHLWLWHGDDLMELKPFTGL